MRRTGFSPNDGNSLDISDIVKVLNFEAKELEQVVEEFKKFESGDLYRKKALKIATNAFLASRVQEMYPYTSEQIQVSILANHEILMENVEFTSSFDRIVELMGQLNN